MNLRVSVHSPDILNSNDKVNNLKDYKLFEEQKNLKKNYLLTTSKPWNTKNEQIPIFKTNNYLTESNTSTKKYSIIFNYY